MTQQLSPWVEGAYGWNFGEGGWNSGMDENLLKFSFLFDRNVDGVVSTLPAAVNGKAYFLTTDNRLYFTVNTTYFSCPTPKWFEFIVRDTGVAYQFNGTSAVQVESLIGVDSRLDAVELSIASLGTASSKNTEFFATTARVDVVEANAQSTTDRAVQVVGEYTSGLVLSNRNQGFRYLEDIYLPTVSTVLPYTTTGVGVGEIVNFRSVGDSVLRLDLADSTKGAGIVSFNDAEIYPAGTVGLELSSLKARITYVEAVGDGVTDDAAAINAALAIGGVVVLPKPSVSYLVNSELTISVPGTLFIGDGMYDSVIKKGFNGTVITIPGNGSKITRIGIAGQGATFTGSGIKPIGYNVIAEECRIVDTQDTPLVFDAAIGSNALAGTYFEANSCFLLPTNTATTYAARSNGSDDSTRPTIRTFRNVNGGGPLPDFSGMNRAILTDSFGTIMKFSSTSSKISISNCRMTNGALNINVLGLDHEIDCNLWGFSAGGSISIDATCVDVFWGPQNLVNIGSGTLGSPTIGHAIAGPMPNNIFTNLVDYTASFVWLGTTSNGVFGNSTVSAYYKLSGRYCYVSFVLVRGNSATNPVGTWSVRLPFKAFVTSVHPILVKSSTGTYSTAILEVQGGSSAAVIFLNGSTASMTDASISFGTTGILEGTISYLVSPT